MINNKHLPTLSCFTSLIFLLSGCYGVQSKYNDQVLNNEKFCIYIDVTDYAQRIFSKTLIDNNLTSRMPNCDYLLVATLYSSALKLSNASGVRLEKRISMTAQYNIYKYNVKHQKQIDNILNNPSLLEFSQYTSGKNASMSKGSGVAITENKEDYFDIQGTLSVYNNTISRLNSVLENVGNGSANASLSHMINNVLLTEGNQETYDTNKQLAQYLASDVLNNAIFDIIDYKRAKYRQKCRAYYDQFLYTDLSKYVKIDGNGEASINNVFSKMNDKEKQEFEKSCAKEFKTYQKEKKEQKQIELDKHSKRIAREQAQRMAIEKAGNRAEIEELKLQTKKNAKQSSRNQRGNEAKQDKARQITKKELKNDKI